MTNENVTTKENLLQILSKCPKCLQSMLNGHLIISIEELSSLKLKNYPKQKKFNLIINTKNDGTTGHWFNLIIFNKKHIFLCDGLNEVYSNTYVMGKIHNFTINNNLILHNFKVKYQSKTSKKCGFLALFQVYKTNTVTFSEFLKFRKMLLRNSVTTNEKLMLKQMKSHFKLR